MRSAARAARRIAGRLGRRFGLHLCAALAAVMVLTLPSAWAAYTGNAGSPVNDLAAGTVTLTDNDSTDTLKLFNLTGMLPGDTATKCIDVTYTGNLPATVKLFDTLGGTGLGAYLDLVVTRGTVTAGTLVPNCTGFSADTVNYKGLGAGVLYSGTLAAYPTSNATGQSDLRTTTAPEVWTTNESHAYRLVITVQSNSAAQGLTASPAFTWQATNISAYSDVVLADAPVGYWKLDETAGTTATDAMGAVNGTYTNAPTLNQTSGVKDAGTAVTFDGVNDYVTLGDNFDFTGRTPMSIEAWYKPLAVGSGWGSIIDKMNNSPRTGYRILICPLLACGGSVSNTFLFERYSGGTWISNIASGVTAVAGTWYHLVFTYDGTSLNFYVNGSAATPTTDTTGAVNTTTTMQFMANHGGEYPNGTLDEVAIYDYKLTAAQVTEHYNIGKR